MITQNYLGKLKQVESGGDPLAKNPKSSAKGLFQFVDATGAQYGLDQYEFGTPEYTQAETDAVKKLTTDNFTFLKSKLNREPSNGELYLAHQQGAQGAVNILTADQEARAVDVLGRDEVLNNGGSEDMTVAQFADKWKGKFSDLDAEQQGLNIKQEGGDQTEDGGQQQEVEIDAFADFGVGEAQTNPSIDAFSDFDVTTQDQFLPQKDEFGDIKKSMIDQSTGAPAYVRQTVGSLYDEESRLATMQKFYPDAQPYGDNNFIFTNPETGKPTLYNPEGLDVGDAASATKEAFIAVGGGAGAFVGGVIGAAASTPTGGLASPATVPAGVVIGGGLGSGIAANLWDSWMAITGQTRDIRTPVERVADTSVEVVGGAAGEAAGRAIPVLAKNAAGGAKATQRAIVEQFERFGVRPSMSVSTGSNMASRLEAGLSQNIITSEILEKQTGEIIDQSHSALKAIVAKFGKAKTKEGAGETIVEAARRAVTVFGEKQDKLYADAFDAVGADTTIQLDAVKKLLSQYKDRLAQAPNSPTLRRALSPAIKEMEAILSTEQMITRSAGTGLLDEAGTPILKEIVESEGAGLQFNTLRQIRTSIGADIGDPLTRTLDKQGMSAVYAALTDDMGKTVAAVSDEAAQKISRADKFTKAFQQTAAERLNKILKYDAPAKAYKFAVSASKDGGSSLTKLRKLFTQDEWDDVAATVLSDLGTHPAGNTEFSISRFVTNYNKLAPEAKDALFKGGRYTEAGKALDDFVDLMGKLKEARRFENTSNTAGAIQVSMVLQGLGVAGVGAFAGQQSDMGAIPGAVGAVVAPRVAAKLMTSPSFIKWLSMPVKEGTKDAAGYFGRLVAIGQANPELRESVNELIGVLEANTAKTED